MFSPKFSERDLRPPSIVLLPNLCFRWPKSMFWNFFKGTHRKQPIHKGKGFKRHLVKSRKSTSYKSKRHHLLCLSWDGLETHLVSFLSLEAETASSLGFGWCDFFRLNILNLMVEALVLVCVLLPGEGIPKQVQGNIEVSVPVACRDRACNGSSKRWVAYPSVMT